MAKIYGQGVIEGAFRSIPIDLAARLVQDSIMSAARVVLNAPDPGVRLEEVIAEMQRFLLQGLSASADLTVG